jgi:hypothetical protein
MNKDEKIPSRTSPRGGRRACLCKDGNTYSKECCDGTLWAQGVGVTVKLPE